MSTFDNFKEFTTTEERETPNGKTIYTIRHHQEYCDCHPETCCHWDGIRWNQDITEKFIPKTV